jgi:integrase
MPTKDKHLASISYPQEVGALLHAIDAYNGAWIMRCDLWWAPLVFVRPAELRAAQWTEFNFEKVEWRIPASRMKMRVLHIVPLSSQAISVLRDLQPLTGRLAFSFPSVRSRLRPISENTITAALRRMGYSGQDIPATGFAAWRRLCSMSKAGIAR